MHLIEAFPCKHRSASLGMTGIGAATAQLFQAEGATVIATRSSIRSVDSVRGDLPRIDLIVSNQSDPAASSALAAEVKAKHGRIDVLFVSAGVAHFSPVDDVDDAFFDT